MSDSLLSIKNLHVSAQVGNQTKPLVAGVSFDIKPSETLALLGESGCGKSLTSLAIMQLLPYGILVESQSQVIFTQKDLLMLSEVKMRDIRGAKIAMIFQEPMTSLNPVMTVYQQVAEVLWIHKKKYSDKKKRVIELLDAVGLPNAEYLLNRYPHELSGGMKQRVMIAMAIACEPDLLIADEPTSALDVTIQKQIIDLLKDLQKQTGMSILLITHDLGVVNEMADTVAVMYAGHIVEMAND